MADTAQNAGNNGGGKEWPFVMTWTGRATALIGLFASLAGGLTWLVTHHRHAVERKTKMDLAQVEVQQQQYQAAVASYEEILKDNPSYEPALAGQLNAAKLWVENFHVVMHNGEDTTAAAAAGALLDQLMPVLETGLARSKGSEAADVQAHIGWAHWLNQKMAEREFGSAAEQNFRAALATDPTNVYANAMLGNWMLQNNGSVSEAVRYFDVADSTGKARPYVRRLELGGLRDVDRKGARAEQVKIADEMRRNGEPLDQEWKSLIVGFCFGPTTTEYDELVESLSAVPAEDAWKTYLWLDDNPSDPDNDRLAQEFIQANLLELNGNRVGALDRFRQLSQQLKNTPSTMIDPVNEAIARLSRN